jgi:hypothetical protein
LTLTVPLPYLCGMQGNDLRMGCPPLKSHLPARIAVLAMLLAGCATPRGADPSAVAERILGPHTGGLVVSVIVPSVARDGVPLAPGRLREAVRRTEAEMARAFGGYTTHTGTHGGWMDENGAVRTEEHAAIVTTYGGARNAEQTLRTVRALAAALARELNQECVAVVVNGRMYLVPPGAP